MTDEAGRFTLDMLRADSEYALYADAEGHALQVVEKVVSGQADLRIALGPDRGVRGQILGPLDSIRHVGRKPVVSVRASFRLAEGGSHGVLHDTEVQHGRFEVKDLPSGEVRIEAGVKTVTVELGDGMESVVVDRRESD